MKCSRSAFAFFALLTLPLVSAHAEGVRYLNDAYIDISRFLNLTGDSQTRLQGTDENGGVCSIGITRTAKALVISPLDSNGAPALGMVPDRDRANVAFVIPAKSATSGGHSVRHLWSSYFIDDDGSSVHGKFGIDFQLEIRVDHQRKIRKVYFQKRQAQDTRSRLITETDCRFGA